MIPKESTPIKNEILIDIFAKGLLNKDEMRIIFYIIRWSWGFDEEERRQDWTRKLKKRKMANDIEMDESHFNRNINKMIIENKIIIKDSRYQFNEHYERWKNLPNSPFLKVKKLTKKSSKTYQKVQFNIPKSPVKLTKKSSLGMPKNQGEDIKNKDVKGGEHLSKETLKKTKKENKEMLRLQIIKYLNKITGAKYKINTPETIKHINARLKEGFTLEDFKYVIEVKWNEWKGKFTKDGKNMEDFMRPMTLFGTKFEGYLNQSKPDPYQKYYKRE